MTLATGSSLTEYADYWGAVATDQREKDPVLARQLRAAVLDQAPKMPDDPVLRNWYHTIELGNGLVSQGTYDLRPTVDLQGLPESLAGKTTLDVGTCDGFWAFEMECRGADRILAVDIETYADFDWLPQVKESV
jgi:hypothetical protein